MSEEDADRTSLARQIAWEEARDCSDPATIGEGFEPCCAPEHEPVIQERAWSSQIWYTPGG